MSRPSKELLKRILNLFRCRHERITWPLTDGKTGEKTVLCLDCGRRVAYSWKTMRSL